MSEQILKINNVEPKESFTHPPVAHPILPQHPFSMLIVAPKGSGKTNLICHLILHQYKEYFNRIVVCSPTLHNDPKWTLVRETKHLLKQNKKLEQIIEGRSKHKKHWKVVYASGKPEERKGEKYTGVIPDDDFFSAQSKIFPILEEQQTVMDFLQDHGYKKQASFLADRMLIVLDDQAGLFRMSNSNNMIVNFVIKHRHYSCSLMIVTQAFKAIPKTIRTNCNAMILFDIASKAELKSIYEELGDVEEDVWYKMYKYCIEEPFSFMYYNNKFPKKERYHKRFESKLVYSDMSSLPDTEESKAFVDDKVDDKVVNK